MGPSLASWKGVVVVALLLGGILPGVWGAVGGATPAGTGDSRLTPSLSPGNYTVAFIEDGLPLSTTWSVTLAGNMGSSSGPEIDFVETNGTYSFTVGSVSGYTPSPPSGSVTVAGSDPPHTFINWTQNAGSYQLTFQESALPPGIGWSVNVDGVVQTSTSSTIVFSLTTPSYAFNAWSSDPTWGPQPASGSGVIPGTSLTISITFKPVVYSVTFTQTGLPTGTSWSVDLNGSVSSSTGATIGFTEINGTYGFLVTSTNKSWSPTPSQGTVSVAGGSVTDQVVFVLQGFTVTFFRPTAGLPHLQLWDVKLNGVLSSTNTTHVFFYNIPNGSYPFVVGSIPGYMATPSSGTVNVTGNSPSQEIDWSQVSYNITFNQSGLGSSPPKWWVNVTGTLIRNSSTIGALNTLTLPNGTYSYKVASPDIRWEPNPHSGSITVNGANLSVPVTFSELNQTVTFTETGLPPGVAWWANYTRLLGGTSTGPSISYQLPNGTYNYTIQPANRSWAAPGGSFTILGAPVSISITFVVQLYKVTFNESTLPGGTSWSVNLTGWYGASSNRTVGNALSFDEPNGTVFAYQVGPVPGFVAANPTGLIRVHGVPGGNVTIRFVPVTFPIRFNETGLPKGTTWWVNVTWTNSTPAVGSNSSVASQGFRLSNGTYSYTTQSANKSWTPEVSHSQFTVNGTGFNGSVVFIVSGYNVTFVANGLPSGALWTVNLGGSAESSTSSTILFYLSNGTYAFSVPFYGVYSPSPRFGNVSVNGVAPPVPVSFVKAQFTVTFAETGLPSAMTWSVTLDGVTQESTASALVFLEVNGTFPFVVKSFGGPSPNPGSGSVRVKGSNPTVSIDFAVPAPSSGLSGAQVALLGALLFGGAVVLLAVVLVRRRRRSGDPAAPEAPPQGAAGAAGAMSPGTPPGREGEPLSAAAGEARLRSIGEPALEHLNARARELRRLLETHPLGSEAARGAAEEIHAATELVRAHRLNEAELALGRAARLLRKRPADP